jgi:hypothetical protein
MRLLNHLRDSGLRQCTPINTDPDVVVEPLLNLSSGYITRALDRMPAQGNRFPWQVYQSYLMDHRATRRADVEDGVMQFTNPASRSEPRTPVATG